MNSVFKAVSPAIFASTILVSTSPAHSSSLDLKENTSPQVIIIDPMDISPLVRESSQLFTKDSPSIHRRIISKSRNGATGLDIGYNTYKKGVSSNQSYAYTSDEVCYIPSGEVLAAREKGDVVHGDGSFIWRPIGAATKSVQVLKDTISVCSFAPARDDGWGYVMSQAEIEKWAENHNDRPKVHDYHHREIIPVNNPDDLHYRGDAIMTKHVVSRQKDGAVLVDVSYNKYKAGLELGSYVNSHEQICWLEAGEIEFIDEGKRKTVKPSQFVYRSSGTKTDRTKFIKDSVAVCFFGPARDNDRSYDIP